MLICGSPYRLLHSYYILYLYILIYNNILTIYLLITIINIIHSHKQLPEEVELIWDDSVAPETALDLDAPHVSTKEVLTMFVGAFVFFGTLYAAVAWSDPVGNNPVALRSTVIPSSTMQQVVGAEVVEEEE